MEKKEKSSLIISIEDEAGIEGWPLPAIVPVVFSRYRKRTEAECYFGVYSELRTFLIENEECLFSKEALEELDRILTPYLLKEGYQRPSGGKYRYYRSFVLWDRKNLNESAIIKSSRVLTREVAEEILENRTDFDIEELLEAELPAAVTVKKGKLLSVATVNMHTEGQRLLEATVYTLPEERGKGYGTSNVALLAKEILKKKQGIVYCCSCHNRASLKIAKSVGFRNESRFYAVDAYKIEE